jgi:hypothetical protein
MIGYLAQAGGSTASSFTHDILVFAHYLFEYAFLVLGLVIVFLLYRSSPEVRIWHIGVPMILGWLATGQYKFLLTSTTKIANGGAAHLGTAVSNVSVGTLLVLVVLVVGLIVLIRRGGE